MKSHFVLLIHMPGVFAFKYLRWTESLCGICGPSGVAGWPVEIDKAKTFEFLPLMICILSKAGRIYLFSWQ